MTRRAALGVVAGVGAILLAEGEASAYATPTVFEDDPAGGGGGGRYFTGTIRDRYTCDVCHVGAAEPVVHVEGLPDGPIAWGTAYTLAVTIESELGPSAAVAEVVDHDGLRVGTVERVPAEDLEGRELCVSGLPATAIYEPHGRAVATMSKCGADRMRFVWTAPETPSRDAILHVCAVASDDSAEPLGDGTFAAEYVLAGSEAEQPAHAGCSTGVPTRADWLALLIPMFLVSRRRSRC